mgnify:CR=1 FL=1|jgi:Uncharacterized protein conserved in bacteria
MKKLLSVAAAVVSVAFSVAHAADDAASFPSRPIKIIIGFNAGGGTDAMLREIANKLSTNLNVPVVVDNRPGANGNIANEAVARAPADGYTLLYNTSSIVLSPHLYKDLKYDFKRDLEPVVLTINMPLVIVAHPSIPTKTPNDFAQYLKNHAGKVNYASAGNGNVTHLATIQLLSGIGANAVHVPYRGEAPAVADLLGGHVQFYMGTSAAMIPLVQGKQVNGIAVTSKARITGIEELPTLAESILPNTEFGAWSGIMAPAGTPHVILEKLNKAFNKVLEDPDVRKKVNASGAEVRGSTVQEYKEFMASEYDRWGIAVKAAGIQRE